MSPVRTVADALPPRASHLLLAAVAIIMTVIIVVPQPAAAQTAPNPSVCDRTQQVRTVILLEVQESDCADVTSAQLASITALLVDSYGTSFNRLADGDFAGMSGLEFLWLNENGLTTLPEDVFDGLSSLEELHLDSNNISTLPEDVFDGLTNLEFLGLTHNLLTTLPEDIFDGLSSLEEIILDDNEISTLPEGVFDGLTNLEQLHLDYNEISTLPEDVFDGLTSLEHLFLFSNPLTTLPEDVFDGLTNLEQLYLDDNEISTLPEDVFDGLTSLAALYLSSNGLTTLPEDVFDGLTSLIQLYLDYNLLTTLPEDVFDGLTSLLRLSIQGNELTALPEDVFDGLTSLEEIWLNDNPLEDDFPSGLFDGLTRLSVLQLGGFSALFPDGLFVGLTNLQSLRADFTEDSWRVFDIELVRTPGSDTEAKLVFPLGAPFDMEVEIGVVYGVARRTIGGVAERVDSVTINTGETESETFDINLNQDLGIDPVVLIFPTILPDTLCGPEGREYFCYEGFTFAAGPSVTPELEARSVTTNSAVIEFDHVPTDYRPASRYFWEVHYRSSDQVYTWWSNGVIVADSSETTQTIALQGLDPDTDYWVRLYPVDDAGAAYGFFTRALDIRTLKIPSPRALEVVVNHRAGGLRFFPPTEFEATGYQIRFKQVGDDTWTEWEAVETETEPSGAVTATTPFTRLVEGAKYEVQFRAITGFDSYSEPASTTITTFIPLPSISRIAPSIREISTRAGEQVRLSANVFGLQDNADDADADNGVGAFARWQPEFMWSQVAGSGSFADPSDGRSVLYTAPSTPGTYTVTAEAGPAGLCESDHAGIPEGMDDPCLATFTIRVSRGADVPPESAEPVNPDGIEPTSLTDDAGVAYAVFTPAAGGTFTGNGITVSAGKGAVPDRQWLGVSATVSPIPMPDTVPGGRMTVAGSYYVVRGVLRNGDPPVTAFQMDEPLTVCLPVPDDFRPNISDVVVVSRNAADGTLAILSSTVRQASGQLTVCGNIGQLPATVAVAKVGLVAVEAVPPTVPSDAETPDTGGFAPVMPIAALAFVATLTALGASASGRFTKRPAAGGQTLRQLPPAVV